VVLRLSDGKELARITLNITSTDIWNTSLRFLHYGGGRIFVASKDDPLAEKQDNSGAKISIYAIEPITKEVKRFDLGDYTSGFYGNFFITEAGDKIFFNGGGDKYSHMIIALDTKSSELVPVFKVAGFEQSYNLKGITPDGSKLCLSVSSFSSKSTSLMYSPAVLDVASGDVKILESAPPDNETGYHEYAISPSGKYVIEGGIDSDFWIYDVEKGTREVLISQDNKTMIFNAQIPGQGGGGLF
jgi:WD40 repeat protein